MTTTLTTSLLLLPLHALAVAGLWRAAYFKERPCADPRGWPRRLPLAAVDRHAPETGVLWPLRWAVERYLPDLLQRPLLVCPACMATVWGPLPYLLTCGLTAEALTLYLLYWPALSAAASAVARAVNPEP
jgi:hypothetical protein